MADNNKPKFDIPWGTLLPLLAVLAGVVAQYKPLVSTRPSVPAEKPVPVVAKQDVDARLWQDPIAVAQKQKSALLADMSAGVVPKDRAQLHDISTLVDLLRTHATSIKGRLLLLGIMIDAGPYSEQGELRLRARQAVLEGLSASGFVPVDGEHIGYVTSPWPLPSEHLANIADSVANSGLLLPWEECEAQGNRERVFPAGTERIIIVWLPATNFNPEPLNLFAQLIDVLAPHDIHDKIDVKLLGPANSTGLQNMVREVRASGWNPNAAHDALDGVSIFSARATAADATLLYDPEAANASPTRTTVKDVLEQAVPRGPRGGLHFMRTIATDDVVLRQLIAELKLRRVAVEAQAGNPHVVLLSEWDTPFGRSLGITFFSEASHQSIDKIMARWTGRPSGPKKPQDQQPRRIHNYRYLRGIDGQLPGEAARGSSQEKTQKSDFGPDTVAIESTEGLNQADYLRRLARLLKEKDTQWRRTDGIGIGAIGLLGSDIYDKLMILRALRPQFRDAVFFTNNYDAHFERRDDLGDTHNLIIGSPFGGELPEFPKWWWQRMPPFRDTNQTALYAATLVATGRIEEKVAEELSQQPRIFEISRSGAFDLSEPWHLEGKSLPVSKKTWFRDWLFTPGVIWLLIVIALMVLATAAWISVSIARRTLPGGGNAVERLRRALVSTTFWLVCGGPLIVFVVALVAQYWAPKEPLAFFSGISIWPTEMLRLIAFMLAIFFMFKANFDLRGNAKRIEKEFSFAPLPLTPFRLRDLGIGFEHWQMRQPAGTSRFSAEEAWHTYLCRNKFWPRFIRIGVLFVLYCIFAFTILQLFPQPLPPARGEMAFRLDNIVFCVASVGLLLLSFYVVDAIQLNSNFIRMFGREVTEWGTEFVDRSHRRPPLTEEELSAYHEIFFVAQRTQAVAPLIWYPLLVLTLLVVARSSFFDNWTWPASLVLIFAITAAWPLGSAILLRRAAEQLRETALNDLRRFRRLGRKSEAKRETFDELIAEIRDLKTGAFAPLTDQPFIRAVLFPGAALGLLAVGQRLFDIF
jgi:hypothetical protein